MKKKVLVIGAIGGATLLVTGWALAQSHGPGFGPPFMRGNGPGGMGPGMVWQMGPGMMMQRMHGAMGPGMMGPGAPGFAFADQAHIDKLKAELGITSAQEAAWTKYAKTVQDAAVTMKAARESAKPANPQDRFSFASKMREQGQKQFEAVKSAANELLATLDDTQKTKAQQILPGLAFGPGMMHGTFAGGPPFRH
ncbi:MAG: Spy/CpxP family protein refolding chaperone [Pseudolabrys sp.]